MSHKDKEKISLALDTECLELSCRYKLGGGVMGS